MLSKTDIAELGVGTYPNVSIYGPNTHVPDRDENGVVKMVDGKPQMKPAFINRRQRRRNKYFRVKNNGPVFKTRIRNGVSKKVQVRAYNKTILDKSAIRTAVENGQLVLGQNGKYLGLYDSIGKVKKRYLKQIAVNP